MNLPRKQTESQTWRPQTCGCQGWGCGRDGAGVWDYQMHIITYRMEGQQGPTV